MTTPRNKIIEALNGKSLTFADFRKVTGLRSEQLEVLLNNLSRNQEIRLYNGRWMLDKALPEVKKLDNDIADLKFEVANVKQKRSYHKRQLDDLEVRLSELQATLADLQERQRSAA